MFVYLSISIYYETMNEINHSHIIIGVGVLVIVLFRRIEKARSKICRTANDLCPHSRSKTLTLVRSHIMGAKDDDCSHKFTKNKQQHNQYY